MDLGSCKCPHSCLLNCCATTCEICIAEALYDVDSIVADPGAYTKKELATLHNQIVSNLEQAWELTGGSEDQLLSTMMQISQVVARQFNKQE